MIGKSRIKKQALIDTGATGGNFVNTIDAEQICEIEGIAPVKLLRPRYVRGFNGETAPPITHAIYPQLQVQGHTEYQCPLFITALGTHSLILGKAWMKQHGVVLDMIHDGIWFTGGHCTHKGAPPKTLELESKDKLQDIQERTNTAPASQTRKADTVSIAQIGAAPFRYLLRKADTQVFALQLQDLYNDKDLGTEEKRVLPEEFHDFLDVFSKKAADELPPHRIYDHHITLEGEAKLGHAPLYNMSQEELEQVKKYLEENLSKGFIVASSAPFASPVLFVRKKDGSLRFCVDYRKLNAITKKDRYPIPLIEETLAQIKGAKYLTKIDIRHAFNRIRMQTPEDEDLTTFRTRYGAYKMRVLPFGLTNGPATFQRFMNETLWDTLNKFASVYMDDILIYSETREEHISHVKQVLQKLREAGLQADIKKCEFLVQETQFLGLIVSTEGIRMDPAKIATILEWLPPKNVTDVQAFLGFCNFYRRFIRGYSEIMKPLTRLTRKDQIFYWDDACEKAFELLKKTVTEAPILRHFDRNKTSYVETDASDYVASGVLSQMDEDNVLHPVAFFSRKLSPAECNYEIYDKELLAIIQCFEAWRPELEGTDLPIQVLSDHKNLEYFMTTKKLTRRQARWAEFLANYNFKIVYRPGKQNGKADALTRRPGDRPEGNLEDDRQKHQMQTLLPSSRFDLTLAPIEEGEGQPWEERVRTAQQEDDLCIQTLQKLKAGERTSTQVALAYCNERDGLLEYKNKVWVPKTIQVQLITEIHAKPATGHPGIGKTLQLLQRQYYWPCMEKTVKQYILNCHICRRTKPARDTYNGLLQPLPIPQQPWKDISMDFVTGLPVSEGNNAILVVACRLSKQRHYIPCYASEEGTTAEATAQLLLRHVWKHHGLPSTIVSDRGPQFIAQVWKDICAKLQIQTKLSTAFHPETDGQTERLNAEMERYLRAYIDYLQSDWTVYLCMAEFAANALPSSATQVSPFFANQGFEPRMSFDLARTNEASENKEPKDIAQHMKQIWELLQDQLAVSQARMEESANRHRKPPPRYQVGDKVWLSTRNIQTQRPSRKLDYKQVGPFKILERIGATSYKLELPSSMKIHPVFHSHLLRLDPDNALEGQHKEPTPPIIVDGEEEWEVEQIMDSKLRYRKLYYKVKWKDHPTDNEWYPASNFEHAPEAVQAFHRRYPKKPTIES